MKEFTQEIYMALLKAYLNHLKGVKDSGVDDKRIKQLINEANNLLLGGVSVWGGAQMYGLPYFAEVLQVHSTIQKATPEQRADWMTSELEEALTTLPLRQQEFAEQRYRDALAEKAREGTLTEFEKAQVARWERADKEQADIARQRLALEGQQKSEEQVRKEKELEFELEKERYLANLGGNPADWIKRWEAKHTPNPFAKPPFGLTEQGEQYSQLAQAHLGKAQSIYSRLPYTAGLPYSVGQDTGTVTEAQLAEALDALRVAKEQEILATQTRGEVAKELAYREATGIYPSPRLPTNVPAPYWLSQFVPSQTAGKPITRERVGTPSPQTWGATPWSVQQGLSGYAEWAGGEPLTDIIGRMESMIPAGGQRQRWLPKRTRTFV